MRENLGENRVKFWKTVKISVFFKKINEISGNIRKVESKLRECFE